MKPHRAGIRPGDAAEHQGVSLALGHFYVLKSFSVFTHDLDERPGVFGLRLDARMGMTLLRKDANNTEAKKRNAYEEGTQVLYDAGGFRHCGRICGQFH